MAKPKKLTNIVVKEISLVDEPATRREFMFWKSAGDEAESAFEKKFKSLRVEFDSDGTTEGSSLSINGKDIGELITFTLSAAPCGEAMSLYCTYTRGEEGESRDGFSPSHTYLLSKALGMEEDEQPMEKAVWTTAYVNDLPDSAFLYVEPGGKKDADGRTVPRSLRHFPVKDAGGKVDLPHLRNAIARIPQSKIPAGKKSALQARARRMLEAARAKVSKGIDPDDIDTLLAYEDELPPTLRRSMKNVIGAVQEMGEPIEKEEEETVLEPETPDGNGQPAPTVDLSGVAGKLDEVLGAVGAVAERVTAIETADRQRQEATEQAAKEAAEHEAAVEAGDEVKFDSEEDALAVIAAEANEEAVKEAEEAT